MFVDKSYVDNSRFIFKYVPENAVFSWSRWYPSSFNLFDHCPTAFLAKYICGIKTPQHPLAELGTRCHAMKHVYYLKVKINRLVEKYKTGGSNEVKEYIFGMFKKVLRSNDEKSVILGFANLEANRFTKIHEKFEGDIDKIRFFYIPPRKEVTVKTEKFGGKLDVIFRDSELGYLPVDWKDGFSKPYNPLGDEYKYSDLKRQIINQVHLYSIVLEDAVVIDVVDDHKVRVTADYFGVIYPRYEICVIDKFSSIVKRNIRARIERFDEMIREREFPMRCNEKWCRWNNKNFPCDYFAPFCKKIMEKELGMIFDPFVDDPHPASFIDI